jgi:glycosyltransferase involved in cell wall biosynthesis
MNTQSPATPRILFVIPGEQRDGGSMVFARRQAVTLASQGGVAVESFYLRSRTSPWILLSEVKRFRKTCAAFQPDVLHAHYGTVTAMFTVLHAQQTPVMITYRGSDLNPVPTERGPRALIGHLLSQVAALGARRIVCVSGKLRDHLWWRKKIVTILPSGVDTEVFRPMPRDQARRQLGWPESVPVVLFNAGRDALNKRLDLAQAAFAHVQAAFPQARLEVMAGGVPPEKVPLLMNAADCLLVTSDAEGSPTVVQEAIASNLPVVSVDVGDVVDRLKGISETHIAARDPRALAAALIDILGRGRRSNGQLHVREIDSLHIAHELTRLYLETIALTAPGKLIAWNTTPSSQR